MCIPIYCTNVYTSGKIPSSVSTSAKIEVVLEQLRQEYIDGSGERLDELDRVLGQMFKGNSDWDGLYVEFCSQVYTMKGTAGS